MRLKLPLRHFFEFALTVVREPGVLYMQSVCRGVVVLAGCFQVVEHRTLLLGAEACDSVVRDNPFQFKLLGKLPNLRKLFKWRA